MTRDALIATYMIKALDKWSTGFSIAWLLGMTASIIGGIGAIVVFIIYLVKDHPYEWHWLILGTIGVLVVLISYLFFHAINRKIDEYRKVLDKEKANG